MTALPGNSPGDGYGHGTFVSGIAAGSATGFTGAAPTADLVSLDVMNDQGVAMTSDVIAAADWIRQNKDAYNIRVANFSLHSTAPASVFWDPLDRAVEKLWLSGVVVVTAAGNYAVNGQASGVRYAPGNDPFVITVGANDIAGTVSTQRRHRGTVVGVRLHARRVRKARHLRAGPLPRRPDVARRHTRADAADERGLTGIHPAVRHVVRRTRRRGNGGALSPRIRAGRRIRSRAR